MEEFKENSFVKFIIKGKEHKGRYICTVNDKRCQVINDSGTKFEIERKYVTRNEPTVVSSEQLRRLWRYEVSWQQLENELDLSRPIDYDEYMVTLDDIRAALTRIKNEHIDNITVRNEWVKPAEKSEKSYEHKGAYFEEAAPGAEQIAGFPDRSNIAGRIIADLRYIKSDDTPVYELADNYIAMIDKFLEDEKKPVIERNYSDDQIWGFVSSWFHNLDEADEEVLGYYRRYVNYLCDSGDVEAIEMKAEECAGGDEAFECDWNFARDIFEKVFNTNGVRYSFDLGKIYYYGRCNDGVPEYEKAYKYFLCDSMNFKMSESRFYLSKMHYNGYGIPQNKPYAYYILDTMRDDLEYLIYGRTSERGFNLMSYNLYDYARASEMMGDYVNAGGVLGMHNYYWHDAGYVNDEPDPEKAYKLYLEGYTALMACDPYEVDERNELVESLKTKINDLVATGLVKKPEKTTKVSTSSLFSNYRKGYSTIVLDVTTLDNGDLKLTYHMNKDTAEGFSRSWCIGLRIPADNSQEPETVLNQVPGMLITIPGAGFGSVVDNLTLIVKNPVLSQNANLNKTIEFDDVNSNAYYLRGKFVVAIDGDYYFTNPDIYETDEEMNK